MARKGEKIIKEATVEDEKLLMDVESNSADTITVRNSKFKVRWMHPATADWITQLMLKDGNDNKVLAQCAALIVLNGFWKSHLFYWILWRWFYYVRQYTASELLPLYETAQKKTAQEGAAAYLNATILLTALSTAKKQMTKAEAERIRQELLSGKDGK